MTFDQFDLKQSTKNAVAALGWGEPTPVQAESIPLLLQGRDLVAQARTGTGKTGAFGLPLVEHAAGAAPGVVGLVLVPTRELALQVSEELAKFARGTPLRVVAVYGGVGFTPQAEALRVRAPILLVATPGRLLDHLQQRTARLDGVRHLILDEADRMLDMGFLPDVERILRAVPAQRQTALFSATLPEPIRRLGQRFLRDPATVRVESGPTATPLAEQFRVQVSQAEKGRALLALLDKEKPTSAIVFTRTKHLARRLARTLEKSGWQAVALQGNMSQSQRERAMDAFREGRATVLVATDIASRGLDVPDVSHIVNYDIPHEPEAYVHRVGRTARMGKQGRAFTFVQPDQQAELRDVERTAGLKLQPFDVGVLPPAAPAEPEPTRPPFHARFSQRAPPTRAPRMRQPQDRQSPQALRREVREGPRRHHAQPATRPAPRREASEPRFARRSDNRKPVRRDGGDAQYENGRGWW